MRKSLTPLAAAALVATGLTAAAPAQAAVTTEITYRTCNAAYAEDYEFTVWYTRDSSNGVVDPTHVRVKWLQFPSSIVPYRGEFRLTPSNGSGTRAVSVVANTKVAINAPGSGSYTWTGLSDSPGADCSVSGSFT